MRGTAVMLVHRIFHCSILNVGNVADPIYVASDAVQRDLTERDRALVNRSDKNLEEDVTLRFQLRQRHKHPGGTTKSATTSSPIW